MSPLALIPFGLYALIATVGAESLVDNQAATSIKKDQTATLKESIIPSAIQNSLKLKLPSTLALASSAGLTDPTVKATIIKAVEMKAEKIEQQFVQTSTTSTDMKATEDDTVKYFPKVQTDDDGGYSAPLSFKDESHNNWMK
jgi:hypothetical protein